MRLTMNEVANQLIPDNKVDFYSTMLNLMLEQLFEWEGPEEIPWEYVERQLIYNGHVLFFYDDAFGHMALPGVSFDFNMYDQPIMARIVHAKYPQVERVIVNELDAFGEGGEIPKEKACVLIENMSGMSGMQNIVKHYAKRMALILSAFDVNVAWQGIGPIMPVVSKDEAKTARTYINRLLSGEPYVPVDTKMFADKKDYMLTPDIPYKADKLHDALNEVFNDFKAHVGLNSSGADKAERLLVDEVNANNDSTQTCLDVMLTHRKKACKLINAVFGLDVKVKRRGPAPEETPEEGVEDGALQSDVGADPQTADIQSF